MAGRAVDERGWETVKVGHALVKLHPDARLIVLPRCSYCQKVAPQCRCGRPGRAT